jgi:hypothetical protein
VEDEVSNASQRSRHKAKPHDFDVYLSPYYTGSLT